MHEAFWNGLFDTRWEDAPLGQEAIRLVQTKNPLLQYDSGLFRVKRVKLLQLCGSSTEAYESELGRTLACSIVFLSSLQPKGRRFKCSTCVQCDR